VFLLEVFPNLYQPTSKVGQAILLASRPSGQPPGKSPAGRISSPPRWLELVVGGRPSRAATGRPTLSQLFSGSPRPAGGPAAGWIGEARSETRAGVPAGPPGSASTSHRQAVEAFLCQLALIPALPS